MHERKALDRYIRSGSIGLVGRGTSGFVGGAARRPQMTSRALGCGSRAEGAQQGSFASNHAVYTSQSDWGGWRGDSRTIATPSPPRPEKYVGPRSHCRNSGSSFASLGATRSGSRPNSRRSSSVTGSSASPVWRAASSRFFRPDTGESGVRMR